MEVLFISETYLREYTYVGGNVQNNVLNSAIRKAQTIKIQSVLGKALYDKIESDLFTSGGNVSGLTTNYVTLFSDYIVPATTAWALFESIVPLTLKFTNKGVSRASDSYAEGIDLETMKYIRDDARNEAEWATERLHKYLCNNSSLFPEYYDYTAQDLLPSQKAGRYSSGIFFKKPSGGNPFFPDKDDYDTFEY